MGDIRKVIFEENKLEKKLCRLVGQAIGDKSRNLAQQR